MKNTSVFPSLLISAVFALGWTTESANAAALDSDGDGVSDYREVKDGTDPNNASSFTALSKGLIAFYPFDGTTKDESGSGFDGTVVGNLKLTNGVTGPNSAYFFDGGAANIDVTSNVLAIGQDYSISSWFRTADPSKVPQTVFNTIPHVGIGFGYSSYSAAGRFPFGIGNPAVSWDYFADGGNQNGAAADSWFNSVLVKKGITYSMYVNGDLQAQVDIPASANYSALVGYRFGSIGSSAHFGYESIKGTLDDVRIYDRALSAAEIKQLFQNEFDTDKDGLTSDIEAESGTNPNNPDTDGDGLKDGAEYLLADLDFDPLVPNGELMDSLFVPSFYPSIEIFAPASTALKISLGGVDTVSTNSVPSGWVFNTTTKQMLGVLSGITSSSGQMTAGKTNGLNLPVTFNFHPQNRQSIGRFDRISSRRVSAPPFVVLPPIASSGLPVTLSVKSGPATISSNNVITITGIGTVVIAANQPGSNNFLPAPEVTTSFRVTP